MIVPQAGRNCEIWDSFWRTLIVTVVLVIRAGVDVSCFGFAVQCGWLAGLEWYGGGWGGQRELY